MVVERDAAWYGGYCQPLGKLVPISCDRQMDGRKTFFLEISGRVYKKKGEENACEAEEGNLCLDGTEDKQRRRF